TGLVNPCLSAGEHTLVCDRSGSGAGTAPSYPPGVGDCGIPATLGADLAVILANVWHRRDALGIWKSRRVNDRPQGRGGESYRVMTARFITFIVAGLALGGCVTETLAPTSEANWKPRDKQLMANLPYAQASIPEQFKRHIVDYTRKEAPGSIVIDSDNKFLYYVLPKGQAIRYGIAVGEEAQAWSGIA